MASAAADDVTECIKNCWHIMLPDVCALFYPTCNGSIASRRWRGVKWNWGGGDVFFCSHVLLAHFCTQRKVVMFSVGLRKKDLNIMLLYFQFSNKAAHNSPFITFFTQVTNSSQNIHGFAGSSCTVKCRFLKTKVQEFQPLQLHRQWCTRVQTCV